MSYAEVAVNYHGVLVDTPCQLDESSENINIDFGDIVNRDLEINGKSKILPLNITLIECDLSISNTLTVEFVGVEDAITPGNLDIPGFDSLSIGFLNVDDDVSINVPYTMVVSDDGTNVLKFSSYIRYSSSLSKRDTIPVGAFSADVTFNIEYP